MNLRDGKAAAPTAFLAPTDRAFFDRRSRKFARRRYARPRRLLVFIKDFGFEPYKSIG